MKSLTTYLDSSRSVRDRITETDRSSVALAAASALVALLVISPMLWLVLRVAEVEPARAYDLIVSGRTALITINSIVLMALVTLFSIGLGVPLAVLTTRTDLPYPRFWTVVAALPLVIPSYIGAIAFVDMFGSGGEVDSLLGTTIPSVDGLSGAIFIITLYTYPYVFLTTRAALLSMDSSIVDAARTLNASRLEAFRRVTFPQIRPGIAAGALLAGLYAISDFGTPAFMGADVFTSRIYWEATEFGREYAALLALQLIAIVAVVLVIEAGIGRDEDATGGGGSGTTIQLGYWKWPAMGFVSLLGLLTLVVPVSIFTSWLFRSEGDPIPSYEFQWRITYDSGGLSVGSGWEIIYNSVHLAVLAALVACLFALPVAYYSARHKSLLSRVLERATYVGFAVPGVVIGLALVFLGNRALPSLYRQGILLLVFAYVVRFLPQAVGTIRSSVLQVDGKTIEAARTLNASRLEAFRRITLPLIMPGVIAGGVLVFLTTMKELPVTLMLRPIGMETLVTLIWNAQDALAYRYAAVPALLLILISGLSMLVLLLQEDSTLS
ncbi:ABC transporter permease [Natronobacterium gregoryi]|uniref:ABC-type Fe3+ transport system, permease component n=2 Tax=Natronobacterium gregoryi TaxID=44930 RepID=L0AG64_NATGS|nr:iron ABC transporter permease [Natronobacterium gregoryi]AFZ72806.1 ABC-type Fe3+ transport system, permease component [Natronobacterium gregoryi SP2]ELY69430.1 iron ABC transporter permease [Natronobacterium gregoryi SP2]PLK21146.1 iron ABC transporter permease [Natronobacterium gregoryi SP2]SFJ10305.1 iron(III) transport system permease protein [Natronobacterium gregoryi]